LLVPDRCRYVDDDVARQRRHDDAQPWAEAYAQVFPPYRLLIESHLKAQEFVTQHERLDAEHT